MDIPSLISMLSQAKLQTVMQCRWEAPGHSGQDSHGQGHHVLLLQAVEHGTCDGGPVQSCVHVPWKPKDPHLKEVSGAPLSLKPVSLKMW